MTTTHILTIGLAASLMAAPMRAETAIEPGSSSGQFTNQQSETIGWAFEVSAPIQVTHLGVFDYDADGLFYSHDVGIWAESSDGSSASLLFQATVPEGDLSDLQDGFRYVSVAPYLLDVGTTYVIGAFYEGYNDPNDIFEFFTRDHYNDPYATFDGSINSGINLLGARESAQGVFDWPSGGDPALQSPYLGPNFRFSDAPRSVPDGGTSALAAMGVLGVILAARRFSHVARV